MSAILYASLILSAAVAGATVVFIRAKQPDQKGLATLHETWMTSVLGFMVIAVGYAVGVMKLMDPTLGGTEPESFYLVAAFIVGCQVLGSFAQLFTWVKKVVAFKNELLVVSPFGVERSIEWADVQKVERMMTGRTLKITSVTGEAVTVNGDAKPFANFLKIARKKVSNKEGKELLRATEMKLRGTGYQRG